MSETAPDVTPAIVSYLEDTLEDRVTETERLADGLNLILRISTASTADAYVVRRPNKLRDTDLFISPEREYGVIEALETTPITAPDPVSFCADESIADAPFLVTTFLDGEVVPSGTLLPERFQMPAARRRVGEELIDTLAEIHRVDTDPFGDLCGRLSPREQITRATARLDAVVDATDCERPRLRAVAEWLRENVPTTTDLTLVHGDFRPGNVLFAGANRPVVSGVLDWETAMLGDPLTELGYLLLRWRDADDPRLSLDGIEARHPDTEAMERVRMLNERGLTPFAAKSGSPSRQELIARYEAATGRSVENERFYRVHAAFMLATVWADLHREALEATGESDRGPYVDYMTLVAEQIIAGAS
jgi:aminoglycoside phosphotransferase (APT) family kinase protein